MILTQTDSKGRNPVHYASSSKYNKSNKTAIAILDISLENTEGYEEF